MDELRFACDVMLGRLARWLRLAGYDASFEPGVTGPALAGKARADGRWLLTSDRELAGMAGPRALLLREHGAGKQVSELRGRLPLAAHPSRFLTRCSRCNGLLEEIGREAVIDRIPPYVATHASRFVACRGCGRVYWPGTHVERIVRTLETLFLA